MKRHSVWAALVVSTFLAATVILPETTYLRYAADFRKLAAPVFCAHGDIDVVFVGTSRMARAVDGPSIAKAYRQQTGADLSLVDYAKIGPSEVVMGTLLEELLERRRVKLIIAELAHLRSGKSWDALQKVGRVMPFVQYVEYVSRIGDHGLARNLKKGIETRMGSLERGLSEPWLGCSEDQSIEGLYDATGPRHQEPAFAGFVKKQRGKEPRDPYSRLLSEGGENHLEAAKEVVDLADRHGSKVVFIGLTAYHEQQIGRARRKRFRAIVGADILKWPASLQDTFRSEYLYANANHLDQDGARTLAPWFARQIGRYLSRHPDPDAAVSSPSTRQ
ncbi:hypothetical protein [Microbaculum marinum]|uniref:SGNH/GDSL hydrolase family protein n=1 Tax=Microbaculum marinum TaxID=1764581 RepID=A0AAW9S1R3_9HYPH